MLPALSNLSPQPSPPVVVWRATDIAGFLQRLRKGEACSMESLRTLLGGGQPLGYASGQGYGFLAIDSAGLKRSIAVLSDASAIVTFDYSEPAPSWSLDSAADLHHTRVQPLVNVIQWGGQPQPVEDISNLDMAGARVGNWVVAFHADARSARSPVSFDAEDGQPGLHFLVTGLAPGIWEIWRNGWLVDPDAPVAPQAGSLYFDGRPGSYFFRRLN